MRRFLVASLAALAVAPAAAAAEGVDRVDPIPASTGPPLNSDWHVNPTVPPAVDRDAWIALARHSIERWGGHYAGLTTASPDETDGRNVIGFASDLPADILGVTEHRDAGEVSEVARPTACSPEPAPFTDDSVVERVSWTTVRLRRDRIRGRKVRRRTVKRRVRRTSYELVRAPVQQEACVTGPSEHYVEKRTSHETDIVVDDDASWGPLPAHPDGEHMDLAQNVLHELGHAAGLSHQRPLCDPRTPMRASIATGDWWRGVDDASRWDCPSNSITADPAAGRAPGPAGFSLDGATVFVNPSVPPGYDADRFVALVRGVVERLGGTYGGLTERAPQSPDLVSVVGFGQLIGSSFAWPSAPLTTRVTTPAHQACQPAPVTVSEKRVKRRRSRRRVGRRRVRIRRDVLVQRVVGASGFACAPQAPTVQESAAGRERDVVLNDGEAWELGPEHPVLATRYDAETAVLKALVGGSGLETVDDACDASTPLAVLIPGDWWRGAGDVSRAECERQDNSAQPRVRRTRTGRRLVVTTTIDN
ncbi:MAG TPA: hypothetical protein VF549_06805 [Solirubrobacteraceae bacterium]